MMKKPRKAKAQVSQTDTSPKTHPDDLLCRLPHEIILEIIGYLVNQPSGRLEKRRKKLRQGSLLLSGKQSRLWLYQHQPESPIMSDFQAFSVVNSKIYSICRPIIWKSLNFPSLISGPMSFWNTELLPKHGSHVKALDVLLRTKWLEIPQKPISIKRAIKNKTSRHYSFRSSDIKKIKFIKEDKEYWEVDRVHSDNLALYNDRGRRDFLKDDAIRTLFGLCPENLVRVLSQCENLTTLCLGTPEWGNLTLQEIHNLSCNISAIFSGLQSLQHLKIQGHEYAPLDAECITEPLKHLPLLESLELEYILELEREDGDGDRDRDDDRLFKCLSRLNQLKKLTLRQVDMVYSSTDSYQGPPRLVDLNITDCYEFCLTKTSRFVNAWAPHLTHLEVEFDDTYKPIPLNQFSLVALTHLTISFTFDLDSLECFSTCENLSHLTLVHFRTERLSKILDSLIYIKFHKLKTLTIRTLGESCSIASMVDCQLFPLEVFCESEGIRLRVLDDRVNYEGWGNESMLFVTHD